MKHSELWSYRAAKAAPQVFVIGGGGSGLAMYRKLARLGIPFATGVLHEHDIDYEAAKYSAAPSDRGRGI